MLEIPFLLWYNEENTQTHMKDSEIIRKLNQAIHSAQSSLEAVAKWSELLAEKNNVEMSPIKEKAKELSDEMIGEEERVVEGIFDGQNMTAKDGTVYPVPTNYASKSKLVEGDSLKLTIKPNGAFVYKQIDMTPRKLCTGRLILEGNQYKVLCEEKTYNVLYASVTFYKAKVGDEVTVIIPEEGDAEWGAVENIIPSKTSSR
ncbi:hypothetical protein K9M59_01805 [Candidatus Gracilibacteria bacterium]|nr:hypothetical protein [Candidatus Gracilibacteria bacterium]MCF7819732.1 hypothetical protein [Candidatus Gracilibacteria bacterium]